MPSAVSERATARASACAHTPLTCSSRSAQHCVPAGTQARAQLRSLVLVLISSEDRMVLMHVEHADPNIDLEFCGLSGHFLSDESVL